jgi:hypothetical protein
MGFCPMVLMEILMKLLGRGAITGEGIFLEYENQQLTIRKWYSFEKGCKAT